MFRRAEGSTERECEFLREEGYLASEVIVDIKDGYTQALAGYTGENCTVGSLRSERDPMRRDSTNRMR